MFGGQRAHLTDVAVAAGLIDLGDRGRVSRLDTGFVDAALARCHAMLAEAVDRMKTDAGDVLLIAVGGGCFLVPETMEGMSRGACTCRTKVWPMPSARRSPRSRARSTRSSRA